MKDLLTAKETANILGFKSTKQLYALVDFFDSRYDDQWELIEHIHFEFTRSSGPRNRRPRLFTESGVEALAAYYDAEKKDFIKKILDLLTQRRVRVRKTLVSRRITQAFFNSSTDFIPRNNLQFVPKKITIDVLQTNTQGYNNSVDRLRKDGSLEGPEALKEDTHFLISEDNNLFWSSKGIARIAMDMKENSSVKRSKSRRAWMEAVTKVVDDCFKKEIKRLKSAPSNIEKAIKDAKRLSHDKCLVTGETQTRGNQLILCGHHLFDKHTRPDLADHLDNILIIKDSIHRKFHSYHGSGILLLRTF